jgi:hypothetical protein
MIFEKEMPNHSWGTAESAREGNYNSLIVTASVEQLNISYADYTKSEKGQGVLINNHESLSWDELCTKLTTYNADDNTKKDGEMWLPSGIETGKNKEDGNTTGWNVLVLDIDSEQANPAPDVDVVAERIKKLGWAAIIATSHSNKSVVLKKGKRIEKANCYRIIIRPEQSIPKHRIKDVVASTAERLELTQWQDKSPTAASQGFYLPRCPQNKLHLKLILNKKNKINQ